MQNVSYLYPSKTVDNEVCIKPNISPKSALEALCILSYPCFVKPMALVWFTDVILPVSPFCQLQPIQSYLASSRSSTATQQLFVISDV